MTVKRHQLISEEYLDEQRTLHAAPEGYGGKGAKWADTVAWVADAVDAGSILDYGCGRGTLARRLATVGRVCREYDPAIDGKHQRPDFADLVVCTDVLEHVERDRLTAVLDHLGALARKAIFMVIALTPANKLLSDGRNAHLILEPQAWWAAQFHARGWTVLEFPDLPVPFKVGGAADAHAKRYIVVVRPC